MKLATYLAPAMPYLFDSARLDFLFAAATTKRIAVIGDAMLDVYLSGDVDRISPEAPVPVVRVRERVTRLGGAANVAQNIVAIGSACSLCAVIGDDAAGDSLREGLSDAGVESGALLVTGRCTTQKTRIVARSQQLLRVDEELDSDHSEVERATITDSALQLIGRADALVFEDYNKGVLSSDVIARAMIEARKLALPIIVDPKFRNFFNYEGATIFKPNVRELEAALGATIDVDHPDTIPNMLDQLAVENILLTLGERGMVLFAKGRIPERIPTMAREVFDVVGAGDTVTAYLAAMLAAGATALEASRIANAAAGVQVGKRGTAVVAPEELRSHLSALEA